MPASRLPSRPPCNAGRFTLPELLYVIVPLFFAMGGFKLGHAIYGRRGALYGMLFAMVCCLALYRWLDHVARSARKRPRVSKPPGKDDPRVS